MFGKHEVDQTLRGAVLCCRACLNKITVLHTLPPFLHTVMSRSSTPGGRPLFASKIAYEALQVESGNEDSEEEYEHVHADSR